MQPCTQMRACLRRWFLQARWASEVERVKEECKKLIPDLHVLLAGAVHPRLQTLEQGAEAEARRTDMLVERSKALWEHLESIMVSAPIVKMRRGTCSLMFQGRSPQLSRAKRAGVRLEGALFGAKGPCQL